MKRWFNIREDRRELPHVFYSGDLSMNLSKHVKHSHPNDLISTEAREVNKHAGLYCRYLRYRTVYSDGQRYKIHDKHCLIDHNCC